MARTHVAVPQVENAVPVDDLIQNLKRDIEIDCRMILQRAQVINSAVRGGGFSIGFWENKVTEVRKTQITTYNINDLKCLRYRCAVLSQELEEFSKKLS
ncbi:MAG: hypothetical protein ABH983_02605 [Candidatus Micrarchaeota archaeon]